MLRNLLTVLLFTITIAGGIYLYKDHKKQEEAPPTTRLKVVTSFSILKDMVENIGRDHVDVHTIVGPNADAHIYTPTPKDAKLLNEADVVIINGLGFEGWMGRLIQASGFKGTTVIASAGIKPKQLTEDGKVLKDPHAWNSIPNAKVYTRNIMMSLQSQDPAHEMDYAKYGEYYQQQLDVLELWIQEQLKDIPAKKRKVITAHDAFQYFGLEYNIKFLAPVGISTEEEASAKGVAKLIDQIKSENIKAVFVENISNRKLIDQIASEAGIEVGGELYSDALSEKSGPAPNYIALMRNNVSLIVKSFH